MNWVNSICTGSEYRRGGNSKGGKILKVADNIERDVTINGVRELIIPDTCTRYRVSIKGWGQFDTTQTRQNLAPNRIRASVSDKFNTAGGGFSGGGSERDRVLRAPIIREKHDALR